MFFSCVGFSIIVPSLAPYLDRLGASKAFLGVVVAIYSFGEMIGSLVWGKVFERAEARGDRAGTRRALQVWGGSSHAAVFSTPVHTLDDGVAISQISAVW